MKFIDFFSGIGGFRIMGIIEKVVNDWKRTKWKEGTFNRENLEDFFLDDFQQWLELGVDEWCNEEWGREG